jgi:hypothetical protein
MHTAAPAMDSRLAGMRGDESDEYVFLLISDGPVKVKPLPA